MKIKENFKIITIRECSYCGNVFFFDRNSWEEFYFDRVFFEKLKPKKLYCDRCSAIQRHVTKIKNNEIFVSIDLEEFKEENFKKIFTKNGKDA